MTHLFLLEQSRDRLDLLAQVLGATRRVRFPPFQRLYLLQKLILPLTCRCLDQRHGLIQLFFRGELHFLQLREMCGFRICHVLLAGVFDDAHSRV